ncbi:MAG: aminotransferase class I/II-fold pyridoxal phosphate-dependent enzyme [Clostridiaceae bacterium]
MSKLPLVDGVISYINENNAYFAMPGHKNGKGFLKDKEGIEFYSNIVKGDITEVEGVDNLHHSSGIIREAEELLSKLYGSYKSYFLVNGSTSGNLAAIFSSFKENDKILVERNCHSSIFNGILLRKLKPVYVNNSINTKYNAPIEIIESDILSLIDANEDAAGVILTYPNYYGVATNIKNIIHKAKKNNMKIIIDSAHGAHFGISELLPQSAVKLGADIVITSSHKTLPALTQTAYLHLNKRELQSKVEFYLKCFQSTSPSYMFMCSMDYARYYLENKGKLDFEKLISILDLYREKINEIDGFYCLSEKDLIDSDLDRSRLVINVEKNFSTSLVYNYLKDNKIQPEFQDGSNIVFIMSPFNDENDFEKLISALKRCPLDKYKKHRMVVKTYKIPKREYYPYEVIERDKEFVEIDKVVNRIAGENIIPYPPGIPLILMGEIIDYDIINMIKYYKRNNIDLVGVCDDKINVLTKGIGDNV